MVRFGMKRAETSPSFSIYNRFRPQSKRTAPLSRRTVPYLHKLGSFYLLIGSIERSYLLPIDNVEEPAYIIRSPVLVVQIIRMFPHIQT